MLISYFVGCWRAAVDREVWAPILRSGEHESLSLISILYFKWLLLVVGLLFLLVFCMFI